MVSTFISLLDIQSWWEIPCIAHFCSLFSSAFNLPDIDIEDLESALLTDGTDDTVGLLPELIACLLRGCDVLKNRNDITTSNYQMFLRRFLRQRCRLYNTKNYFDTDIDFQSLPLRNKLLILHSLCHFRLESKKVQTILSNLEADSLRVEPLGYDSKNSGYWYFYGTRLYREDKPGGRNSIWQVICFTEEDWKNLAAKFKNSTSRKECALYNILVENFLPKLPQLFRERERLRRRKLLQVRNSVRSRNLVDEKKLQFQKQETESIEKQKFSDELKLEGVNKFKGRLRRRNSLIFLFEISQASSTASGISTYASSLKTSINSCDFLNQREKFCLSPDLGQLPLKSYEEDEYEKNVNQSKFDISDISKIQIQNKPKKIKSSRVKLPSKDSDNSVDDSDDSPNQEDKENCCFVTSNSDSERSFIESKPSVEKIEMAPTTNIKLPGRQTNNSLSSLAGNIFIPPTVFGTNNSNPPTVTADCAKTKEKTQSSSSVISENSPKKKKSKSCNLTKRENSPSKHHSLNFAETDEVLQIGMHKVLVYVKNHRDAWPFMDPVEEDIAPRYYSIIRRPMDLLKMEEKLDNGEYRKFSEFRNDFKLIVNNCRLYNGQNNEYTEMVNNLQEAFDKATKKYFDQNSSDEEIQLSYPDSKMNVFLKDRRGTKDNEELVPNIVKSADEEVINNGRGNKRKRKDKDKRRKKKSKTKLSSNVYSEDESNVGTLSHDRVEAEISDVESESGNHKKVGPEKKTTDKGKSISVASSKKLKGKSGIKEKERIDDKKGLSNSKLKPSMKKLEEDKNKKNIKVSKNSKNSKKITAIPKKNEEEKRIEKVEEIDQKEKKSDKDFISDNSLTDHPIRNKTKVKNSPSRQSSSVNGKNKKSEKIKDGNSSNKSKHEKENQNVKSKSGKKETAQIQEVGHGATSKPTTKDNNKISNNSNKKRKTKGKKLDTKNLEAVEQQPQKNSDESNSCSRSPSPVFKVDLHKKYAKSASTKIEDEPTNTKSKVISSQLNIKKKQTKDDNDEELLSISSRSLSRSPSPFNSIESEEIEDGFKSSKTNASANKKIEKTETQSPSQSQEKEGNTKFPTFLDKYDLIKQRRNRNTDEKWNQIVKEAEKIKDNKKNSLSKITCSNTSKEKNQKLKETIEKLKVKNAKSKERSVLIDEIFGVKPSQEIRDEKTIFEKIRETCLDSKSPLAPVKPGETIKRSSDEYDFVDELIVPTQTATVKKNDSVSEKPSVAKKQATKKGNSQKRNANKTNMEALELETEQTLKDINRWLEHTPRFPEFSSASNSPSRYNLLDDFDAVASKLDPADFRRPDAIVAPKIDAITKINDNFDELAEDKRDHDVIEDLIPPSTSVNSNVATTTTNTTSPSEAATVTAPQKVKEPQTTNATQLLPHPPPPPPHVKSQQQKETKRKTLKEKLTGVHRRKDLLRTIDRLQPGKSKGNLLSNIHNTNKPEELVPLGASKVKEIKNSLVVETDETAPKLSLGSVLNTEGFGLGQLHNFGDDIGSNELKMSETKDEQAEKKDEDSEALNDAVEEGGEAENKNDNDTDVKVEPKNEKQSATPNLSAWFKAFGAPKKTKKSEEEEKKSESEQSQLQTQAEKVSLDTSCSTNSFTTLKSPPTNENFPLPAPRQRKASTGSTISERSSFSQDPDSPRIGIDDRFGTYPGPYASPIGASPIMVSPKPDEISKPTSPYPLNGAIKVGFYQDTTTKSSPEKSCSPRELPSPYPQYSQHIYSSASSPNDMTNSYGTCYNSTTDQNKSQSFASTSPATIYEQYKQPQSQESDYNSSMSPSTNPNSPYQQPQNSPYQQHQTSPYQQTQSSPYQQPQNSPFQTQTSGSQTLLTNPPPVSQQSPGMGQQTQVESPQGQNSPYQQPSNSPYQQSTNSPYHQTPASPYQQNPLNFGPPSASNQSSEGPQPQQNKTPYSPDNNQYGMHEENNSQYQQSSNQNPQLRSYEQDISKRVPNLINKIQTQPEWNSQMEIPVVSAQTTQVSSGSIVELAPMVTSQLNTPPLQTDSITVANQIQQENSKHNNVQYQNYPHYDTSEKDVSKTQNIFNSDIAMDYQRDLGPPDLSKANQVNPNKRSTNEPEIMNIGYPDSQPNKIQKREEKHFDSTLNKQQQMFDSFLGSMGNNKSLSGFNKPLDISTSKAFEMFNRAATMGFPKEFPNPHMGNNKVDTTMTANNQPPPQLAPQSYHINTGKTMDGTHAGINNANKPINMVSNNQQYNQQMQMNQNTNAKMQTFQNTLTNIGDNGKLHQQQGQNLYSEPPKHVQQQHQQGNNYPTNLVQGPPEKLNDLVIPNPRQDQMGGGISRNQHLNVDLSNYKPTYNNPASMLDPLRNLNHPLTMMDETMLGLQSSSPSGYYDKNIPPAHIFPKNIGQQVYQNPSGYGTREQQNPAAPFIPPVSTNVSTIQSLDNMEPKVAKRTKKKKSATPIPTEVVNSQNQPTMLPVSQQQQIPVQAHPNQQNPQSQGFQLYAGLKTAATSVSGSVDSSAISLKTATSMVPGSAFNFGPPPTGLALATGIYGDNSGYLDEFRAAPNPYYIAPTHRTTPDAVNEKPINSGTPTASPAYHQFLPHTTSRSSYPFMNSPQLDVNSPLYQQYLQRQEEFRARMMLNHQGLLGPGAPTGYPQPGYRPTLGMPKHYDMNRQPWFQ